MFPGQAAFVPRLWARRVELPPSAQAPWEPDPEDSELVISPAMAVLWASSCMASGRGSRVGGLQPLQQLSSGGKIPFHQLSDLPRGLRTQAQRSKERLGLQAPHMWGSASPRPAPAPEQVCAECPRRVHCRELKDPDIQKHLTLPSSSKQTALAFPVGTRALGD